MKKLYFRYAAMGAGKTLALLSVAFNYKERGQSAIIIKPNVDKKGGDTIVSRAGLSQKVDYLIHPTDNLHDVLKPKKCTVNCILVDEAQFLTKQQVDQLHEISVLNNIPVICYGLRTDFRGEPFEGSARLLQVADELEELKTICDCGKKASYSARYLDGRIVFEGDQVCIDTINKDYTYKSLCSECFLTEKGLYRIRKKNVADADN